MLAFGKQGGGGGFGVKHSGAIENFERQGVGDLRAIDDDKVDRFLVLRGTGFELVEVEDCQRREHMIAAAFELDRIIQSFFLA
ncbi:hypothetical protein D9M71_359720 [compost metagenome]